MKAPHPCQQPGSNAKGDDVGQGIKLSAKIAFGTRHSSNEAVDTIEDHREANGHGCKIHVPVFAVTAMYGLQDGVKTCSDVGGSEDRRKKVHAFAQASARAIKFGAIRIQLFHEPSRSPLAPTPTGCATGRTASTVAPPWTRSPRET